MLKKSASGVLAALRGSTYRSLRLASSLAAALLDGLFEHPAGCTLVIQTCRPVKLQCAHRVFPQPASPDRSSFPLHLSIFCLSGDHQAQRTSWNRRVKLVTGYQDQGRVFPVKRDSACSTIDDATIADLKDLPGVVYVK